MKTKGKMIAYWTVTLLLAAAIMLSGIGQLMKYGVILKKVRKNKVYTLPE